VPLIQACLDPRQPATRDREETALLSGMDALKSKEGMIVTEDFEEEKRKNGKVIRYIPLWSFLLDADQDRPSEVP